MSGTRSSAYCPLDLPISLLSNPLCCLLTRRLRHLQPLGPHGMILSRPFRRAEARERAISGKHCCERPSDIGERLGDLGATIADLAMSCHAASFNTASLRAELSPVDSASNRLPRVKKKRPKMLRIRVPEQAAAAISPPLIPEFTYNFPHAKGDDPFLDTSTPRLSKFSSKRTGPALIRWRLVTALSSTPHPRPRTFAALPSEPPKPSMCLIASAAESFFHFLNLCLAGNLPSRLTKRHPRSGPSLRSPRGARE